MQINMICIWLDDIQVYQAILRDQKAFIDAVSYVCTRMKYSHSHSMRTPAKPVRVYLSQLPGFRSASTYQEIRAAIHGPVAESCCHTLTLFGQITTVSDPISTLFGFQKRCNGCGCDYVSAQHEMSSETFLKMWVRYGEK
jgi:hypothetical protein